MQFNLNVAHNLTAALPGFRGLSRIAETHGANGADVVISGAGYECFYTFSPVSGREVYFAFVKGNSQCPQTYHLHKDPPF